MLGGMAGAKKNGVGVFVSLSLAKIKKVNVKVRVVKNSSAMWLFIDT
jgi:hypothetical protein